MLTGQPWPRKLLQYDVVPWLVAIARARPVKLWAVGGPEDLVQICGAMATRAAHPCLSSTKGIRVEAFATAPGPRDELAVELARASGAGHGLATITVELSPRAPQGFVDLVSLRRGNQRGSAAEACAAVRPGGRLLSDKPMEETIGLWRLDKSGQLLYKAGPKGQVPRHERKDYENSLVVSHMGLARALARRFEGRGEQREELEQVALAAMAACARRYDPTRGVPFGGYAAQSVLGELKRHFRDRTWGAHVSRPLQERYLALKEARESLSQSYGRSPTVTEVSAHLHSTEEEVLEAMEAGSTYLPLSLDRPCPSTGESIDLKCPDDAIEHAIDLDNLATALPNLEPLEKLAIKRYFFQEQTQQSIADEIGVSQMQVSRIVSRAVARLRASFVDA